MKTKALVFSFCAACWLGLSTGCGSGASEEDPAAARAVEPAPCVSPGEAERLADQVLELINLERTSADLPLPPVRLHPALCKVAGSYACRMIEGGFFGHYDPITGRGPGQRAIAGKYAFYAVGENLAAGQQTAVEVMKVWMESPSHELIILDAKWRDVGIAVRTGGEHVIYWVLEFGDPANL